jgi:phage/plasmid-associated DNA primase
VVKANNTTSAAGVSGVTIAVIGIFAAVVAIIKAVALYCLLKKPTHSPVDSEKELYKIYDSYSKENAVTIRLNDSFSESGLTHPMQSFNREFFQHPNQQQSLVQNSQLHHLFDHSDESGIIPSQDNPTHRSDVGII